jgi:hypothetical protein
MAIDSLKTYFLKIGRPCKPDEMPPAQFDLPKDANNIQRETVFGDLHC